MKIFPFNQKARQRGSLMYFLVFLLIVCFTTASLGYFVAQTSSIAIRRANLVAARKYAESGVMIGCSDLNNALPSASNVPTNLTTLLQNAGYTQTSWPVGSNLFSRTINASSLFSNAPVTIQILLSNTALPSAAMICAQSTVGVVSMGSTNVVTISIFGSAGGAGAAIISVNNGGPATALNQTDALTGNVVVSNAGPLVVSGANVGLAVSANGMVNVSASANVSPGGISSTNGGTVNAIPDYTNQGSSNALFNLNQFIAIANDTSNVPTSINPTGNDHFTNLTSLILAANKLGPNGYLEGMVVVDVATNDPIATNNLMTSGAFAGAGGSINVHGTLFFNFVGSGWAASQSRLILYCGLKINPANTAGVVQSNPSTYTSGFPPQYNNSSLNPTNVNVSPTYPNIQPGQSLPALVYSSGILSLNGPVNISGVVYTPNYMALQEYYSGQSQYIRGAIITGGGIYVGNPYATSATTVSYDPNTLANLATLNNVGQQVEIAYWVQ